jgi:hypothetical protein
VHPLSTRPSIPFDTKGLNHVTGLLRVIESLPPKATGVLRFLPHGEVYLEDGYVCWATYPGQRQRLEQLLCYQQSPPLELENLGRIIDDCRNRQTSLCEALIASGGVSEAGLRAALLSHSAECVARIASSGWYGPIFDSRASTGLDARFVFSTVELLTQLGAGKHLALSARARKTLADALASGGTGLAFVRDENINHAILIAVLGKVTASVSQAREVCAWTSSMFDLARSVDDGVYVASGSWRGNQAVLTWVCDGVNYTGMFQNRASATLALNRLTRARVTAQDGANVERTDANPGR